MGAELPLVNVMIGSLPPSIRQRLGTLVIGRRPTGTFHRQIRTAMQSSQSVLNAPTGTEKIQKPGWLIWSRFFRKRNLPV